MFEIVLLILKLNINCDLQLRANVTSTDLFFLFKK